MPFPNLDQTLQQVNIQKVQFNDAEAERNSEILQNVIKLFRSEFKKDKLFDLMFKECFYGGSYYDRLKVGAPNEFDIDFVFVLPQRYSPHIYTNSHEYPGYVQIHIPDFIRKSKPHYYQPLSSPYRQVNRASNSPKPWNIKKLFSNNGNLCISKVTAWFQSIVDKAKYSLACEGKVNCIERESAGKPAITFTISNYQGQTFDVDFVPCFQFELKQWPKGFRKCPRFGHSDKADCKGYFVVPKPKDSSTVSEIYFRLSFQGQERYILKDKDNLKSAIKLLKVLRDLYEDNLIKSYYIKTVALWALKSGIKYEGESLGHTFIQLLESYIDMIEDQDIPYYWKSDLNLLENCNEEYLQDLANRLRNNLKDFKEGNPYKIQQIFKLS